jgi:hypothetical protein
VADGMGLQSMVLEKNFGKVPKLKGFKNLKK